jgi:hypothetical protein
MSLSVCCVYFRSDYLLVQAEVDVLKLALYLNLSQCFLKLENWDAVITNCTHALTVEPKRYVSTLRSIAISTAAAIKQSSVTLLLAVRGNWMQLL